jgi:hypothetical protein
MQKDISMNSLVRLSDFFASIADVFPEIQLAYLYGSQVEGNTGPLSDWDIGLLFESSTHKDDLVCPLALELSKAFPGWRFDIVLLGHVPIELAYRIISYGELLYERDVTIRVEFEAKIMGRYGDLLPLLRSQRQDILKGGEHAARVHRYRKTLGRTERTLEQIRASQK